MKAISSSFFGRLFGHHTKIIFNNDGLTVTLKNSTTKIGWQALTSPPVFSFGWLGQTMLFSTSEQNYQLSKLAYNSNKKHNFPCQALWVENNKSRLEILLSQINKFINSQYLRQSNLQRIQVAVEREYVRWFPWMQSNSDFPQAAEMAQLLSTYQHWQTRDVTACRERYINKQVKKYQTFFDTVESNPLTPRQRRACIIDDDNNLLLAGAGTGKTSVMIGRTGYLLNSQQASFNDILLLAYGRKAANEMDERIKDKLATDKISATTFHHLGLNIIAQVEGGKPKLSRFAEDEKAKSKWVQTCFENLIDDQAQYRHLVLEYFSKYYYVEKNDFEFDTLGEYYQYLTDSDIRSLKGEKVKSFGELYIANWLFNHGIEYQYEASYQFDVQTVARRQYQPDFFLPELNIYIEYFGVDENDDTAPYINRDEYHASMQWKRKTHQHYNTQCIELTYSLHKRGMLLNSLQKCLTDKQIEYELLPDDVMLASLQETGQLTVLAEIFAKLIGLYKAACLDKNAEQGIIATSIDKQQMEKAFELLGPILTAYQARLFANNEIDFEDMISKALEYIETGRFRSTWRYIMVDEFQDISEPRARLVKALRDSNKGSSVFAVGDDWQAIYRFSGADVALTTGFENYFGPTSKTELDQTFRFNDRIGQVATDFVSKNPAQIDKTIKSIKQVTAPAVSILRKGAGVSSYDEKTVNEIENGAIDEVLRAIANKVSKPVTLYLLARFWFQLPDKATIARLNNQYPLLQIETQSFHAAKGKEADYVVIIGLKSGKHGFPSTKVAPPILEALLAKQENFKHAEERRLFYVALTRAKERVYIIADMVEASCFVKELIDEGDVELNEFGITVNQAFFEQINCLVCETGTLKARTGRYGPFYSCSHFPLCEHKERACVKCESVMTKSKHRGFKVCLNPSCHDIFPLCQQCGAEMVLRESKRGPFWGCRNYRGNDALSCKHGVDKSKIQWPPLLRM
ncbi:UvrD-helicase domain-containing protein [Psychromonas hadalis]|uniref:UvrD-helicase domain-containing protein n=1 Tax=Psychromonas hadalis TaxID=211669 RepID=UPI0003B35CA5|nr:UvrD-helicase domain-containing protein [Psychromonas hadalis]